MGKRGPAPRGDYANKSAVLSTRIQTETRLALQEAAAISGRSLSQEIETRLRRSFDFDDRVSDAFGDRRFYSLMRLVAATMSMMVNPAKTPTWPPKTGWELLEENVKTGSWLDDPYMYDQAVKAVVVVLDAHRPKGDVNLSPSSFASSDWWFDQLKSELYAAVARHQGALTAEQVLVELADAPDVLPAVSPKSPKDRLPWIKADLANLADRIPEQGGATAAVKALVQAMLAEAQKNDPRIPEEIKQNIRRKRELDTEQTAKEPGK